MDRRGFLQRLVTAPLALVAARHLSALAPKPPALALHPKAFEIATTGLGTAHYEGEYEGRVQVGNVIRISLPQRYRVRAREA